MSHYAPLENPPPGFSWLSPSCRPSPDEVQTYAHLIHASENSPADLEDCLREAELQLWIWRNEMRQRAPGRRRRSARPEMNDGVHALVIGGAAYTS